MGCQFSILFPKVCLYTKLRFMVADDLFAVNTGYGAQLLLQLSVL